VYALHLEQRLDHDSLAAAVRALFHAPRDDVRLYASVEDIERERDGIVACVVRDCGGEFPLAVELFPGAGMDCLPISDLVIARFMAARCASRCLIADGSLDPYLWTLVEEDGSTRTVSVQPEALERAELVIEEGFPQPADFPRRGPSLVSDDDHDA
jgi:hypothetical protein